MTPTPKRHWSFSQRHLLVVVLGVALVYAGAYHQTSRNGLRQAQRLGAEGFFYAPPGRTGDLSRHYRLRVFYAPANIVDQALFGGPSPISGGTIDLD